ncbi:GntR family transcriptional regulator [Leisingera sp. ANG-M1]|uniref:GntR family transcriptional regulator n=1 Tax=Leisingera sp. ANG-M1 TaxID=1577895 RepID=UPI00068F5265|nr:GntR family transcriptional regulator [Leisingera sp. ANG-M1]
MAKAKQTSEQKASGPLYLQLATTLRREISTGILKAGQKLPTISALADSQGVSIITVRQAIEVLENEGLVKRFQGKGTFVSDEPNVAATLTLRSDWGSLLEHLEGKKPTLITVADKAATPLLDPKLGNLESEYRFMRRVHTFDGLPYALINIYLSQRIADLAPKAFEEGMVISQLSRMPEARIARMQQRISFTTADVETAELLGLPVNAAIGDVLRVITDTDGNAIYVGQTKYRGDFVNLEFDIQEPPK